MERKKKIKGCGAGGGGGWGGSLLQPLNLEFPGSNPELALCTITLTKPYQNIKRK